MAVTLRLPWNISARSFTDQPCSVIALSKLYSLNDPRLAQTTVKGDLIVDQTSDKIMTRSRAKQSTKSNC
jgi:hypothetical protein